MNENLLEFYGDTYGCDDILLQHNLQPDKNYKIIIGADNDWGGSINGALWDNIQIFCNYLLTQK